MEAHASGALWMPDISTAVIADLHLGYSWAQRRRGELGPLADYRTREKLQAVCLELRPKQIVFLGDLVHAPRPCAPEREWIEQILIEASECATLIAVRGNHDRAFASEFGHLPILTTDVWSIDGVTALHGDRLIAAIPEHHVVLLGHLHPAIDIRATSGAGRRLPIFVSSPHCILLPAFSPFAGGFDISAGVPPELRCFFRSKELKAVIASGTRAVPLGSLQRALDKIASSDVRVAAKYRDRRRRPAPVPSPNPAQG